MKEFSVDNGLHILTRHDTWQLKRPDTEGVVLIAHADGVRYSQGFAESRHLPAGVTLRPHDDIRQVVIGWEVSDAKWHLGFMLATDLSKARRSRWCEIASWYDANAESRHAMMEEIGRSLAQVLGVTFYQVPTVMTDVGGSVGDTTTTYDDFNQAGGAHAEAPAQVPDDEAHAQVPDDEAHAQVPDAEAHSAFEEALDALTPPPPLPDLPLYLGDWRLERHEGKLTFLRERHWVNAQYRKMAWLGLWSVIYLAISALTLMSELALPNTGTLIPNPQILPYIGLGVAFILAMRVVYAVVSLRGQARLIVIDSAHETIVAYHGTRRLGACNVRDVRSVYVSEITSKRAHDRNTDYGEINFHLGLGKFWFVLKHEDKLDNSPMPAPAHMPAKTTGILPLDRWHCFTPLQASGLYIAEALNVPAWYDMRLS